MKNKLEMWYSSLSPKEIKLQIPWWVGTLSLAVPVILFFLVIKDRPYDTVGLLFEICQD